MLPGVETEMVSVEGSASALESTVFQCVLQQSITLCIYFVCFLKLGLFSITYILFI